MRSHRNSGFWYKVAVVFLMLALIVPVLFGCGKEKKETPTVTATAVATPIVTPRTGTPTPTPNLGPVKIGAVGDVSGPGSAGMLPQLQGAAVAVDVINKAGGILGGRPVELVTFDMRGDTAQAAAGAEKLIQQDKVSALTMGGWLEAHAYAVAGAAQDSGTLFVTYFPDPALYDKYPNMVCVYPGPPSYVVGAQAALKDLQPKTAAYFGDDDIGVRGTINVVKGVLDAAGVKNVYEQYYVSTTTDFSSYLTKIKYVDPDIVVCYPTFAPTAAIYKQISDLGGWGNIKYLIISQYYTDADQKVPGAIGQYALVARFTGVQEPGPQRFEQAWRDKYGGEPAPYSQHGYDTVMVAALAVDKAGSSTDLKAIAEAARHVTFESSLGHADFNGTPWIGTPMRLVQNVDGVQQLMP